MSDKLRELDRYDHDDIGNNFSCSDVPVDNNGEWVKFDDIEKMIDTPEHETVEQWETRTGEPYPDDCPVWWQQDGRTGCPNTFELYTRGYCENMLAWIRMLDEDKKEQLIIIANHKGKPDSNLHNTRNDI